GIAAASRIHSAWEPHAIAATATRYRGSISRRLATHLRSARTFHCERRDRAEVARASYQPKEAPPATRRGWNDESQRTPERRRLRQSSAGGSRVASVRAVHISKRPRRHSCRDRPAFHQDDWRPRTAPTR